MGRLFDLSKSLLGALVLSAGLSSAVAACAKESHVRKAALITVGIFPREDLIAQTIEALNDGSDAIGGVHDYDIAQQMGFAGVGQLEGTYSVAENKASQMEAMYLLNRAWVGATFAFIMDAYERAQEKEDNEVEIEYQARRARAGFARGRWYGEKLLNEQYDGFSEAQKNIDTLKAWLAENIDDPEMADQLMWLGYAWIGRVSIDTDNPEVVSELWVGVELLRHVLALDETVNDGAVHVILGAYHARSALSELDEAKKHFDRALEINEGKYLATKVNLAARYYCMKRDKKNWERELREVLAAKDPLPSQRLTNAIAKRQARRYLDHEIWAEPCAFD